MFNINFSTLRKAYENSPRFVKSAVGLVPFSILAGRHYRETLQRNLDIDSASQEQILDLQSKKLGRLLDYATQQVPYYQNFRHLVEKYPPLDALKEFPIVDKDDVQSQPELFLSNEIDKIPHYETTTGGTSGNQLRIILENNSHSCETAFIHRLWGRVNYETSCKKATFRGHVIEGKKTNEFWQENPIYRELMFSSFHMSADNLDNYLQKLQEYSPKYIHGYPSAVATLANQILATGKKTNLKLNAVLLGSEAAFIEQREAIELAFGCRVFTWYGHSERLILAGECEQNSSYHQLPDYGLAEIVKPDSTVAQPGETGELVGTTLNNRVMPLIRYRTGDYATRLESRCECGRNHFRFDAVQGRWNQEFLIGRSGAKIFSTALNMHGDAFTHVMRYQYYQNKVGLVKVKILPSASYSDKDTQTIYQLIKDRIGHDFDIDCEIVKEIPLTTRGKFKRLIQETENHE